MPAVLTERRGAVLVVTIDRPEARNAVDRAVAEGIAAALDELDGDDDLSVGRPHRPRTRFLVRHGPQGRLAMELAMTGEPTDAERPHALGVVNRLAEPGGALDAALELA